MVAYLDGRDGRDRLRLLVADIERWVRWSREDGGLEQCYDPAAYGLSWALVTGRLNGRTASAIEGMTTRQMCQLIHELTEKCQHQGEYPRYLMERYDPE